MLLVATLAAGQTMPSAKTTEPIHLALNGILGLELGMNREALPKSTPSRELRCTIPDTHGDKRCKLLVNDDVRIGGASVLFADFVLDSNNKVVNIAFSLNTSRVGFDPLVFSLKKKFGEPFGKAKLPLLCWQNQVSNLLLLAGDHPPVIAMSLIPKCERYDERRELEIGE
jgi:hypothetical protein